MPEPLYKNLVERLHIPNYLAQIPRDTVAGLFVGAFKPLADTSSQRAEKVIGHVLHVATVTVLRSDDLQATLEAIKLDPVLGKYDETTVITVAYAYHLLTDPNAAFGFKVEGVSPEQRQQARRVLDDVGWMLPAEAMEHLGIERLV